MREEAKGARLKDTRITLWVLVAVALLAFAGTRLVASLSHFGAGPFGPYAKGAMAKLSFKFAGQPVPGVVISGPDGGQTSLGAFRGKAVLMNLWATWCGPCVEELPALDKLEADLGGEKFQVVAVNMDNRALAARFLADHKLVHLALYTDPNLLMDPALAGPGIPASVLYDQQGREIARVFGATDWASSEARALIDRIIHQPKEK